MIKDANLMVDNLKIVGQLYLPDKASPPYPAVILCHGVPSGIVDPTDPGYPLLAQTIADQGFAVYTFRFRGTGESEGNFDIAGWTRDLESAIDYLWNLKDIDPAHIILIGFSAGAATAIYTGALDKRVYGIVSCASPSDFSVITDVEKPKYTIDHFRNIGIIRDPEFPPSMERWLNDFRRVSAIDSIAGISPRPLLIIHGTADTVVSVQSAHKLFERAGEPKQKVIIESGEHRLRRNETAVQTILKWLKEQLAQNSSG